MEKKGCINSIHSEDRLIFQGYRTLQRFGAGESRLNQKWGPESRLGRMAASVNRLMI